jgi:hypothetical protein
LVRVIDEISGLIFEQKITADLTAATQFLSPCIFVNTGATAAVAMTGPGSAPNRPGAPQSGPKQA